MGKNIFFTILLTLLGLIFEACKKLNIAFFFKPRPIITPEFFFAIAILLTQFIIICDLKQMTNIVYLYFAIFWALIWIIAFVYRTYNLQYSMIDYSKRLKKLFAYLENMLSIENKKNKWGDLGKFIVILIDTIFPSVRKKAEDFLPNVKKVERWFSKGIVLFRIFLVVRVLVFFLNLVVYISTTIGLYIYAFHNKTLIESVAEGLYLFLGEQSNLAFPPSVTFLIIIITIAGYICSIALIAVILEMLNYSVNLINDSAKPVIEILEESYTGMLAYIDESKKTTPDFGKDESKIKETIKYLNLIIENKSVDQNIKNKLIEMKNSFEQYL